ncbi:MAG: quinolinate synthase NadA [Gammaproteobacteria bacterium]|nr:quinolinate synthase NadA [Gammaproteobacteria bacterium]MBU1558440.1 quinolinate synthase NadA [Gammaproteobacteria bacterium]MBU2546025.1 quinolinate synthase NadA [Gammaproteobacteria bacterium]
MFKHFQTISTQLTSTTTLIPTDMPICQTDYPLDWYQPTFVPYAKEYQALPDRKPETVQRWMQTYIEPALEHFGDHLLLLAHYYMGGEIVKLIERFGGKIGDSYQLAVISAQSPEKKIIVESAVHFMAETISMLSNADQRVFITNPKAGCTMEMFAKDYMVEPALRDLNQRYGKENILPICYMNTSGRIKALTGAQGGAVCTSSNVRKIMEWALRSNKKILFIPDRYMGENVAYWMDIPSDLIAYWPSGMEGANYNLFAQDKTTLEHFDRSPLILFASECNVHSYFAPEMVDYWHRKNFAVIAHPECRNAVVRKADNCGSTTLIWDYVYNDQANTKRYAVGTENHMVQNLKIACLTRDIEVVNLGDAPLSGFKGIGCGCATMSRNDPPHLVATLDLLRKENVLAENEVQAGDVVNEFTGKRERLDETGQQWIKEHAKKALNRMIEITEGP